MFKQVSLKKKIITLLAIQIFVFNFCIIAIPASVYAAKNSIPAGCPGSSQKLKKGQKKPKNCPKQSNPKANAAPQGSAITRQCSHDFFGLVPWYNYLGPEFNATSKAVSHGVGGTNQDNCSIKCFNLFTRQASDPNDCGQTRSDIPYVLLAIVDDLLRVAGIVAVVFVLVGAFNYVGSQGNPESTAHAQNTIVNALIGLAVAIVAVAFVSYIGSRI